MCIVFLILYSGFRKDSRKPFKNYVVLVSLDAFRWDYSKIYNTSNLNKLASEGVKADRLISSFPELNNVDVYNLVCKILDIKPAPNDGNPAHIKGMLR